jgi:hypothetical protein
MDEVAFYNLFSPNKNQENYLFISGGKFKIDSFLTSEISYEPTRVSYTCQILINDETLGKWLRLGKIEAGTTSYSVSSLKLANSKDKKEFKLAKIGQAIEVKTKSYNINLKEANKLKIKITIPTDQIEEIFEQYVNIKGDWSTANNKEEVNRADLMDLED